MNINSELLERLIRSARDAAKHSHCPHTKFAAGAAVLVDDGHIFNGCRVENAAAALTMCACRAAIFHAVCEGYTEVEAVLTYIPGKIVKAPCGACRQVINEFGSESDVYSICDSPEVFHRKLKDLLPAAFGPELP